MMQGFALRRLVMGGTLLFAFWGCDGTPMDNAPPAEGTRAQISPANSEEGKAQVEVIFNAAPQITSMGSSDGRVASKAPVTLQAVAGDTDGDPLSYSWTSNCPGAFDSKHEPKVTFVTGTLAVDAICAFEVVVSDGRGGSGKGTLTLSSSLPKIDVAPEMGVVYQ